MSPVSREPDDDVDLVEDPDDKNINLVQDPDCHRMAHGWMQNSIINKHARYHHSGTNIMKSRGIIVYDPILQYILSAVKGLNQN